jgi:hypothetical protein
MTTFTKQMALPVSCEEAFHWHERSGALDRLMPPWESVTLLQRGEDIDVGTQVVLKHRIGPFPIKWVAEHTEYVPGRLFRDVQRSGPFSKWDHLHRFEIDEADGSAQPVLIDEVDYALPMGPIGRLLAGRFVRDKLETMFAFRHRVTLQDLLLHKICSPTPLHFAVTGSSGLVGSALCALLTTGGHQVTRMVRGEAQNDGECFWDPSGQAAWGFPDETDVVIHLGGKNIASGRWTDSRKREMLESRVRGTTVLSEKLSESRSKPKTLIVASAIGYYGDRGDQWLDEGSTKGDGFLSGLVQDWEASTALAEDAGIRVVHARLGIVLSTKGGALQKMLTPFRLGGGGRVGNGQQYWSWISLNDAISAMLYLATNTDVSGPVNLVSPDVVTNGEFTAILAGVLRRPALLPAPAFLLRTVLGEMADELLLASARVRPDVLTAQNYAFRDRELEQTLRWELGAVNG